MGGENRTYLDDGHGKVVEAPEGYDARNRKKAAPHLKPGEAAGEAAKLEESKKGH